MTYTTRRAALHRCARSAAAAALVAGTKPATAGPDEVLLLDTSEACDLIQRHCSRSFLDVVMTEGFLYRGLPIDAPTDRASLFVAPRSDLLDEDTYDAEAARFFASLDVAMASMPVRPSNGHLASPVSKDAALWGQPASVWPVGEAHWAFCRGSSRRTTNTLFWPPPLPKDRDRSSSSSSSSSAFSTSGGSRGGSGRSLVDALGLVVDRGLTGAIRDGDEVLFTSSIVDGGRIRSGRGAWTVGTRQLPRAPTSGSYLAVPLAMERELRAGFVGSLLA